MSKEIQERYDRLLEQMELQGKTQAQLTEEMEKLTKLLLASETAWQQRFGPMQRDFYRLAAIWKTTTVHWSNITEKCSHPAYREIIALGPDVLPLIFDELEREPDDWFVALRDAYHGVQSGSRYSLAGTSRTRQTHGLNGPNNMGKDRTLCRQLNAGAQACGPSNSKRKMGE